MFFLKLIKLLGHKVGKVSKVGKVQLIKVLINCLKEVRIIYRNCSVGAR